MMTIIKMKVSLIIIAIVIIITLASMIVAQAEAQLIIDSYYSYQGKSNAHPTSSKDVVKSSFIQAKSDQDSSKPISDPDSVDMSKYEGLDLIQSDKDTRMRYIWDYMLKNWNLSPIQVAGIMGNLHQECKYAWWLTEGYNVENNPTQDYFDLISSRNNDFGVRRGWGLIQWTDWGVNVGRRTEFNRFAESQQKEYWDIGVQLEFLKYELTDKPEYKYYFQYTAGDDVNIAQAVFIFHDYVESSADSRQKIFDLRVKPAIEAYTAMMSTPPPDYSDDSIAIGSSYVQRRTKWKAKFGHKSSN